MWHSQTSTKPDLPTGPVWCLLCSLCPVDGGQDGPEGSQIDVVGQAHPPILLAGALVLKEDIGHALGVGAVGNGVGGVVQKGCLLYTSDAADE